MNAYSPIGLSPVALSAIPAGWSVVEGGATASDTEVAAVEVEAPADPVEIEPEPHNGARGEFTIESQALAGMIEALTRVVERRHTIQGGAIVPPMILK